MNSHYRSLAQRAADAAEARRLADPRELLYRLMPIGLDTHKPNRRQWRRGTYKQADTYRIRANDRAKQMLGRSKRSKFCPWFALETSPLS